MTIYKKLLEAGCKISNHESDIYVLVTPKSRKIVKDYENRSSVTTFVSNVDKKFWYSIPLAYAPFWNK